MADAPRDRRAVHPPCGHVGVGTSTRPPPHCCRVTALDATAAGRYRGEHWSTRSQGAIDAQRLLRSLRLLRSANLTCYMLLLAFFERPVWCYASDSCGDPNIVLGMGLPMLPTPASQAISALAL